jgi:hypothetical protein
VRASETRLALEALTPTLSQRERETGASMAATATDEVTIYTTPT